MNFGEFIRYKECCPICNKKMGINLVSTRTYRFRYSEENYVFSTTMKSLGKNPSSYEVDFILNLSDDKFRVEFYDKAKKLVTTYIPMSFIDGFKEFVSNQKRLIFERKCVNCYQYKYQSSHLKLNFSKGVLSAIDVSLETICHYRKIDDENTRVFKIEYSGFNNSSLLSVKDVNTDNLIKMTPFSGLHIDYNNEINCPYRIEVFEFKDQDLEKLETLFTFS